jgi:hypothetical protein
MSIPSAAIYMLGYEYLLARISPVFTGSNDPAANTSSLSRNRTPGVTASLTPAPLVAGALARTISATVISPIEMFRTRLQALPGGGSRLASLRHQLTNSGPCIPYICNDNAGTRQTRQDERSDHLVAGSRSHALARCAILRYVGSYLSAGPGADDQVYTGRALKS